MTGLIVRLVRRAFPLLDYYLELGAAIDSAQQMVTYRDDLQVVLYRGQIRVGYADEPHGDLEVRAGTLDVQPLSDNWQAAIRLGSRLPVRQVESVR